MIQGARYGWSQAEIYQRSGYTCDKASAAMAASRLIKNDQIRQRLAELNAPAVRKSRVTVESLLGELEQTIAEARQAKQFSAVNGSLALMGKLTGLLRDKIEVGSISDFDGLSTPEEVVERVRAELGDEAAELLEASVGLPPPTPDQIIDRLIKDAGGSAAMLIDQLRELIGMVESRAAERAIPIAPPVKTTAPPTKARPSEVAAVLRFLAPGKLLT